MGFHLFTLFSRWGFHTHQTSKHFFSFVNRIGKMVFSYLLRHFPFFAYFRFVSQEKKKVLPLLYLLFILFEIKILSEFDHFTATFKVIVTIFILAHNIFFSSFFSPTANQVAHFRLSIMAHDFPCGFVTTGNVNGCRERYSHIELILSESINQ